MTHETLVEEIVAFVEVDGVGVALFESKNGFKLTVSGSKECVKEIPLTTTAQRVRSEIEKESKNTFFNDWYDEQEKLDDGTSKEDAVIFMEKIIPLAKTCPFCGKVPVFTYSVGKRDASGYVGHFTKREGCCDATGMGKTELFFCNKDKSENYGLWAKQMFWQIQKWNERSTPTPITNEDNLK